jgi:dethiobiotin synthetase
MTKGFIITGTDTDVGKTFVTATLSLWLQDQGVNLGPMKPVQTGSVFRDNVWNAPDLDFTLSMLGKSPAPEHRKLMQPFCYEPACSPHLAVPAGDTGPTCDAIVGAAMELSHHHDAIVVEGAGGLMVPLNDREMMVDLFTALRLPIVLVARVGLGTINHTLLSIEALKRRGLTVAGVVMNETTPQSADDAFIRADNPKTITHFGKVPFLGTLPFSPEPTPDTLRSAARHLSGLPEVFAQILSA